MNRPSPSPQAASRPILAATVYFALVFGAGAVLGAVRTLWLAPRLGATGAVLAELPVMLAVSAWTAARCVRWFAVSATVPARLAMGGVALGLLQAAELGLALTLAGRTTAGYFAGLATPAGALGLAGQGAFALLPLWVRPRAA